VDKMERDANKWFDSQDLDIQCTAAYDGLEVSI